MADRKQQITTYVYYHAVSQICFELRAFTIQENENTRLRYTKDYFHKDFTIDETVSNIEALNSILIERNPATAGILARCRYAVNDSFVDNFFTIAH